VEQSVMGVERAVGYVRVSTELQAESGLSLEAQRAKLQAYCVLHELQLVSIESDEGWSGKSMQRPGLDRALALLDQQQARSLVVAKLDRLTRSVRDLMTLIERYFENGTHSLRSATENIDTRTPAGRLVLTVLGAVSQWEREAIAERTREVLAHLRQQGIAMGRASYGSEYQTTVNESERCSLVRVQEEAVVIGVICQLHVQGLSLQDICQSLTRSGYRTKLGGRWHPKVVRSILQRAGHATRRGAHALGSTDRK
jgi:site-specific DNA recombinase